MSPPVSKQQSQRPSSPPSQRLGGKPSPSEAILKAIRSLVVPLVEVDGGKVFLVRLGDDEVALHLAGTCAGCPGTTLTTRGVIEPAIRSAVPAARVTVTSGANIPDAATLLRP